MKSTIFLPFLALLLNCELSQAADPEPIQPSSGGGNGISYNKTGRSYKIIITLDGAFEKLGNEPENLGELQSDMKFVKAQLENMTKDIREMRNEGRCCQSSRSQCEISVPKRNCKELRLSGELRSGVYSIQPDRSKNPFEVYCDMVTDGGGWTVFQRRGVLNMTKSAREDFYRNWTDYEMGFGSPNCDYWLGLEKMHMLTQGCNHELIVNLTKWDNTLQFARYGEFHLTDKADFYRLTVSKHSGTIDDGLIHHNKMRFSTHDKDNDSKDENCAQLYHGGWWYNNCFWSNLNGEYANDGSGGTMTERTGMEWTSQRFYSYMRTEMKVRPKC